jgi:hypothetical protein
VNAVDITDKRTVEWLERYPTEDRGKKLEDDEKRRSGVIRHRFVLMTVVMEERLRQNHCLSS